MDGAVVDSRAPKADANAHLVVKIPETAHQISQGLFCFYFLCLIADIYIHIHIYEYIYTYSHTQIAYLDLMFVFLVI